MSDDRQETTDDIIESMERFASSHWMHDEGQNVREFAARLKSALKRERAAFDCECAGIAELAAKEEAARHKPGNAAAMREALLRCEAISCLPEIREQQCVRDMRNIIAAALSAPARNCDIYPKRDDAGEAWNKTLDERTRDMAQRYPLTAMDMFIDWLLAYAEDGGVS